MMIQKPAQNAAMGHPMNTSNWREGIGGGGDDMVRQGRGKGREHRKASLEMEGGQHSATHHDGGNNNDFSRQSPQPFSLVSLVG
jgi:hypothetical protein